MVALVCEDIATQGEMPGKEVNRMGTEAERQDTRKAMAFDLCNIIDEIPDGDNLTKEEVKKIIRVYVTTADQK